MAVSDPVEDLAAVLRATAIGPPSRNASGRPFEDNAERVVPRPEPATESETEAEEEPAASAEPFRIEVYGARDLCALEPPRLGEQLVGPLLRRARITLLGGITGHGKTTFGTLLLAAAVLGRDFIRWKRAGNLRALVLDLEQHLEDAREQLVMAASKTPSRSTTRRSRKGSPPIRTASTSPS
jgi:hypothetical protein